MNGHVLSKFSLLLFHEADSSSSSGDNDADGNDDDGDNKDGDDYWVFWLLLHFLPVWTAPPVMMVIVITVMRMYCSRCFSTEWQYNYNVYLH